MQVLTDIADVVSKIFNSCSKIFSIIINGIGTFVDFIISFPSLIYDLVDFIPEPLFYVLSCFLGLILLIIIFKIVKIFPTF